MDWKTFILVVAAFGSVAGTRCLADEPPQESGNLPEASRPLSPAPVRPLDASSEKQQNLRPKDSESESPKLGRDQVKQLIAELDSPDFKTRMKATRGLSRVGLDGIPLLVEAAKEGDLETTTRVISVLKRIYPGMSTLGDSASEALETLNESSDKNVSDTARKILSEFHEIRDQRALAEIRSLNGRVRFHTPIGATGAESIAYIILVEDWSGGDKGLKYLRRLSSLTTLYVINGAKVSQKALESLYDQFPGLRIQVRGSAYLGIASDRTPLNGNGCVVTKVEPNSAAQRAGLAEFDIIRGFDGSPIRNFEHLIQEIMQRNGGDEISLEVERRGLPLRLKCTLGTWAAIE